MQLIHLGHSQGEFCGPSLESPKYTISIYHLGFSIQRFRVRGSGTYITTTTHITNVYGHCSLDRYHSAPQIGECLELWESKPTNMCRRLFVRSKPAFAVLHLTNYDMRARPISSGWECRREPTLNPVKAYCLR